MASSRAGPSGRADSPPALDDSPIEDDDKVEDSEIPLTMTASVVLTSLPKDARSALRDAGREKDAERKGSCYPEFCSF